jgi:hypothetical protein
MLWLFRGLCPLLLLLCFSGAAYAQVPLVFRDSPRDVREESIIAFLLDQKKLVPELPYELAERDLNSDGVGEWVVRQARASNCAAQASCDFFIIGLSDNAPVLLGALAAGKLIVSDENLYGINILYVYNQPNNDFEYTRYRWNPENAAFLP